MDISFRVAQSWGSGHARGRAVPYRLSAAMSSNGRRCQMAEFGPPTEQIVLANVMVSDDVDHSRRS